MASAGKEQSAKSWKWNSAIKKFRRRKRVPGSIQYSMHQVPGSIHYPMHHLLWSERHFKVMTTLHVHVPWGLICRASCCSVSVFRGASAAQCTENGMSDGAATLQQPLQVSGRASGTTTAKTDMNILVFELPMKEALLKLQMFFYTGFNCILHFTSSIEYHSCITSLKFDKCYILTANILALPRELFLNEYSCCVFKLRSQQIPKLMPHELLNSAWLHIRLMMMPSSVNCHTGLTNSLQIHVHRQNSSMAQCAALCIAGCTTNCLYYLQIYSTESVMEKWQSGEDFHLYPALAWLSHKGQLKTWWKHS